MEPVSLLVSSSPHVRSRASTSRIMLDVLIALVPAVVAGIMAYGYYAAVVIGVTVASALAAEWVTRVLILKKNNRISDLSAAVTGLLLGLNLPPTIPIPLAILGSAFAIFFVKELFGGLGQNFMNPALGARVFLLIAWPGFMTGWINPGVDAIAGPTPLAILKGAEAGDAVLPSLWQLLTGLHSGCIGEASTLALIIGGAYLLIRRVIGPMIPALYLGTVALMVWLFGGVDAAGNMVLFSGNVGVHLLSGGLLLGAFFMATDYSTRPVSRGGVIIYAVLLGLVTAVIRLWTHYPEGVSFAIILMNCLVPLIDRHTIPTPFGGKKRA